MKYYMKRAIHKNIPSMCLLKTLTEGDWVTVVFIDLPTVACGCMVPFAFDKCSAIVCPFFDSVF